MRIKREADNFCCMASECMIQFASLSIPQTRCFIKGSSHNFVTIGIVKGNGVDNISVTFQGQQFVACGCVPNFAGSVVAASDKLVTRLVEGTVGKRQDVSTQDF